MNKKTIFIGLGVLAVAGIGYYMWKKKNETTSGACGCSAADGEDEDESSNATAGAGKTDTRCPKGYVYDNLKCKKYTSVAFTADDTDTYVSGWENEPKSGYTAGWDKGSPRPCAVGYSASLDPIKGTICTALTKSSKA
jgi:hypothetical protein